MTLLMLNGELIETDKACLPVTDRAVTHGLGLYETLKLVGSRPAFFAEHADRLEHGLRQLGLEAPCSRAELAGQIVRLSESRAVADGACRVLVTAGPPNGRPALLIQAEERRFLARPLSVITHKGTRVRAQLKAMSVMQSYLAQQAAKSAGADDAVLVDEGGHLVEGATSNLFVLRADELITPPNDGTILPGVMRATIESIAGAHGISLRAGFVRVDELRPSDGVLLTSSVRGLVTVAEIDGRRLTSDLPLVARLRELVAEREAASLARFDAGEFGAAD